MGFLQELPTAEQLTDILAPVLGDKAAGTGVAGVLQLLQQIDAAKLSAKLSLDLDQSVSANIRADTSGLTGGALAQFQSSLAAFPADPASLVAPLAANFQNLRGLSTDTLQGQLNGGIAGLQALENLIPADVGSLVGQAAESLAGLKGEFISGAFGELRQWSQQLEPLRAELEPLVSGGQGTAEERLLAYLRQKIADLLAIILPDEVGRLAQLVTQIETGLQSPLASRISTLKAELIAAMERARVEFDAGNFTNTAHFQAAQSGFEALLQALADLTAFLRRVIDSIATGIGNLLRQQYDHLMSIEIVDLGNIRDRFAKAIGQVEELLGKLNLESVRQTIEGLFQQLNAMVDQFKLPNLLDQVTGLQGQLESLLGMLDGGLFEAVATLRNLFAQLKQALQGVMSSLGSFDAGGQFHFAVQDQIESFLTGVRTTLTETVRPLLESFRTTVRGVLEQIQTALTTVRQQIETVKNQLQQTLEGVHQQLLSIDVPGSMQRIRGQLEAMLNSLQQFDFDPVVDPVVAQINEMRDTLAKIDVSALSEFTIGALKVSVEVVTQLDFSSQITDVLMAEIDEILQIPKDALAQIEAEVEGALQRFGELAPGAILSPLDDLFGPVRAGLDAFDLQSLLQPLDEWYGQLLQSLEGISPASLLAPLVSLHGELMTSFEAISPEALIRPLRELVTGLKEQLQAINLGSVVEELGGVASRVRGLLEQISPDRLLNPLTSAFDKVMAALDSFDPAVLLEPLKGIFQTIIGPLENLTAENAALIAQIFAPLRELISLFDPRVLFTRLAGSFTNLRDLLAQVNLGGLIADLNTPYKAMQAAFQTHAGESNISLSASVEGLNPLRNPALGQVTADFRQYQSRLETLAQGQPPAELVQRYDKDIKPRLEQIIPIWARENITAASIRRAFQLINPFNLETEVRQLYQTLKDKLQLFNPRQIQEGMRAIFQRLLDNLNALSPEAINARVQAGIGALTQRLDALNLDLIVNEVRDLTGELASLLAALNPQPLISQLESLVGEVMALAAELKPSQLLAELEQPFQAAKQIVLEFDPAVFKEALQAVFDEINELLAQIDVGILLEPLVERLEQLRSELEQNLNRTETAFNGMLAAIPI